MRVLVVSEHEVEHLLTMAECIGVMERALASVSRGEVHQPLRQVIRAPNAAGFFGLMPSYGLSFYGLKEVCVFPNNPSHGLDTHLGAVLLHSGETGQLLAIVNASAVTAIRTAAVSAVATRLLAREDAQTLAIIGAGVQAKTHLEAIPLVRDIREVRVFSRTREKAERLLGEVAGSPFPVAGEMHRSRNAPGNRQPATGNWAAKVVDSAEHAVRGADIVVTATSSRDPVLRREWIAPGTHINAVGSSIASSRELDAATVAASSLFVDRRESTVNESGEYLFALQENAIAGPAHIRGEIGELLNGTVRGRTSRDEITLFKSLGLAIEDLASAAFIYEKASRSGAANFVEF